MCRRIWEWGIEGSVNGQIANLVTTQTNGAEFGARWQRDRELVEGENILPAIRDMLNEEVRRRVSLTRRLNSKPSFTSWSCTPL